MKIVIAIDSFKGSATSLELARYAAEALGALDRSIEVVQVPVSDGGEGTVESIATAMGDRAEIVTVEVSAPLPELKTVRAKYALLDGGATAVMEMAAASGLTLVPPKLRNPLSTSTIGTGQMIADAIERGCRRIVLGLGGSATNDAATGVLCALGFEFVDAQGHHVYPCGGNLHKIVGFTDEGVSQAVRDTEFVILCDVDNPLCGINGAAHIYAPQKGATPEDVATLDKGLAHFSRLIPHDVALMPGAGAAGGMGAGMAAFLNADIKPGISTILETIGFERMVDDADLVITGEGRIDNQTAMGKAPAGILAIAKRHNVPTVAVCGALADDCDVEASGFTAVFPIVSGACTLEEVMRPDVTERNFKRTVAQIVKTFLANRW